MNTAYPGNVAAISAGFSIARTAAHLRNYAAVERARVRILAGWFLRIGDFEHKYRLAYHLYDASEHVTWLRARLKEMRAGNADASVRPELKAFLAECLHAPGDAAFLAGFYGVLTRALLAALDADLEQLDASGNANEVRLLRRMRDTIKAQMEWHASLPDETVPTEWVRHLGDMLAACGGLHGECPRGEAVQSCVTIRFERPQTILFDARIRRSQLAAYEERLAMDSRQATIEQFRVFFNEFYAAALLASILFDAADGDFPWEFFADFSRHFWDEARHSEFGAIRLRELGVEPDRVNPVLFDESQGLPVLHRVAYLTRGLEAYFMPRKPKRMKEYEEIGDLRSQLFADQDWSDEINHVRYGVKWCDYLLEDDAREIDDIIEECKQHLAQIRGGEVRDISAPF
jgi:uncharacterized ferritin-like protein (DUF455 family)